MRRLSWFPISWKLLLNDPKYWVRIWFVRWRYLFAVEEVAENNRVYFNRLQKFLLQKPDGLTYADTGVKK